MRTSLSERQKIEENYHNTLYKNNDSGSGVTRTGESAFHQFRSLRGDVKGLRVLDFGCGSGWLSVELAKEGAAEVYGIDISHELISKAAAFAEHAGQSEKLHFMKMPCEDLAFPDNYFDLIIGSAILHHTDLNKAIQNISRVLKRGGRALFIEPLNQNIFLKTWRRITPWRRSPVERALVANDLKLILGTLPDSRLYFHYLLSIFTAGLIIAFPNSKFIALGNTVMEGFDNKILRRAPALRKYCAIVIMDLVKS